MNRNHSIRIRFTVDELSLVRNVNKVRVQIFLSAFLEGKHFI